MVKVSGAPMILRLIIVVATAVAVLSPAAFASFL